MGFLACWLWVSRVSWLMFLNIVLVSLQDTYNFIDCTWFTFFMHYIDVLQKYKCVIQTEGDLLPFQYTHIWNFWTFNIWKLFCFCTEIKHINFTSDSVSFPSICTIEPCGVLLSGIVVVVYANHIFLLIALYMFETMKLCDGQGSLENFLNQGRLGFLLSCLSAFTDSVALECYLFMKLG